MSDEESNIARIQGYADHPGLLNLWREIQQDKTHKDWDEGKAFEYLILRAFELEGAEVVWPYSVRLESEEIEQIDGVVYAGGLCCLSEAKAHSKNVDFAPIAKMRNQLLRRPAGVIGLKFSRTGFTESAKYLSRFTMPQAILL